eukprot:1822888-Alexandrium_andersonii.AAC.1
MSASLVGSEMCIRDSCLQGTGGDDDLNEAAENSHPEARFGTLLGRTSGSCLLYTSDAADDM